MCCFVSLGIPRLTVYRNFARSERGENVTRKPISRRKAVQLPKHKGKRNVRVV